MPGGLTVGRAFGPYCCRRAAASAWPRPFGELCKTATISSAGMAWGGAGKVYAVLAAMGDDFTFTPNSPCCRAPPPGTGRCPCPGFLPCSVFPLCQAGGGNAVTLAVQDVTANDQRAAASYIRRFISATALARPVKTARAMMAWPMFSSRTPGIAATLFTL